MSDIGLYNYWIVIGLMMIGLYAVIAKGNLIKKMMGLGIFQSAVIMMYISMGKIAGGTAPILVETGGHGGEHGGEHAAAAVIYSNPLPHVLMLTAIVVGVATLAVGLALTVRIFEAYGTLEEDEILAKDREDGPAPDPGDLLEML